MGEASRGDINQGLGNNLAIDRVDGNPDGKGLPDSFTITANDTGEQATYYRGEEDERFENNSRT